MSAPEKPSVRFARACRSTSSASGLLPGGADPLRVEAEGARALYKMRVNFRALTGQAFSRVVNALPSMSPSEQKNASHVDFYKHALTNGTVF